MYVPIIVCFSLHRFPLGHCSRCTTPLGGFSVLKTVDCFHSMYIFYMYSLWLRIKDSFFFMQHNFYAQTDRISNALKFCLKKTKFFFSLVFLGRPKHFSSYCMWVQTSHVPMKYTCVWVLCSKWIMIMKQH